MNNNLFSTKTIKSLFFLIIGCFFLISCNGKIPGADARKFPADPKERVKQNLKEGRGFTLNEAFGSGGSGGKFEFASSNPLWRASLDVLDFMPLTSVNYSGGIIITDWYSDVNKPNESIKITIRFLSNEIRSDSLNVKIFSRNCLNSSVNCKIIETDKILVKEINKQILKKAALYEKEDLLKKGKKRKRPE